MITSKQAAERAAAHIRELFDVGELKHLRLEELEPAEDGKKWLVTLGWVEPAVFDPMGGLFGGRGAQASPRVYKLVTVNAETGDIESMKIRKV